MKKILWLKVTQDQYELPLAITDTAQEMAELYDVSIQAVKSSASDYNKDRRKCTPFRSVKLSDEDE